MIISSGIGSGLDIANLVQQLVDAERAPAANRLNSRQSRVTAELSALGQYRGALTSFQTALDELGDDSVFGSVSARSGNEDRYTVTAEAGSAGGSYEIEIEQLAQAHRLASGSFADADTAVGTGTLTLELGTESFSLDIASGSDGLAAIRDAINSAADNPGINASLITTDDGTRLVLAGAETGASQSIRVTSSGGGLDALAYDPGTLENLGELEPAQDAKIRVDGFLASSANNRFDSVIEGVVITAVEAAPGETDTLSVSRDEAAIVAGIEKFVARYNNLVGTVGNLTRVDSEGTGSLLTGDSMLRSAGNRLRSLLGREVGDGSINRLAQLGIEFDAQGRLNLDKEALTAALADDFGAVTQYFAADNGLVKRVNEAIDSLIDSDGLIQGREDGLDASLERIEDQREALDRRIAAVEARYQSQFAALDSLIAQLRNTSDYLSAQLQNLPGPGS